MALIKCKECGQDISEKAKTCPHCGCPQEVKEQKKEPKKRFSSKEYKMTGFICSIVCTLILLLFLLGITFNNIILSIMISAVYGGTIYILSKYLLNTKQHIKKYLWLVIMIITIPLLISFILLIQNKEWSHKDDEIEYNIGINGMNVCSFYYKNSSIEIKSKKCNYEKLKEGVFNYRLTLIDKKDKEYFISCYGSSDGKTYECTNPEKNSSDKFIKLTKK